VPIRTTTSLLLLFLVSMSSITMATEAELESMENKLYTLASVKTLKTADQVIGTLLDIKA